MPLSRANTRKNSSRRHSDSGNSSRKATKPVNADELRRALMLVGVAEANAQIIAGAALSVVGIYDPNKRVAEAAAAAAEEVTEELKHAPHTKQVEKALTEAASAATASNAQAGGAWDTPLFGGIYTKATAFMGAVSFGAVQATKNILEAAGCDPRVINIVCFMIPCLLHGLPELIAPGAVPGLAYAQPRLKAD